MFASVRRIVGSAREANGCAASALPAGGSLNALVILICPSTVKLVVNQHEGIVDWSDV
jgi:hypothetical protein